MVKCVNCILLLVLSSTIGSHIYRFLGYVVSLQARSCNEMGFPTIFNSKQFSPYTLLTFTFGTQLVMEPGGNEPGPRLDLVISWTLSDNRGGRDAPLRADRRKREASKLRLAGWPYGDKIILKFWPWYCCKECCFLAAVNDMGFSQCNIVRLRYEGEIYARIWVESELLGRGHNFSKKA